MKANPTQKNCNYCHSELVDLKFYNFLNFRLWLIILSVLFMTVPLWAQTIEGVVMGPGRSGIQAANIYLNSSKVHSHSNEIGQFSIAPAYPGDTLYISSLGYVTRSIILNEEHFSETIRISLNEQLYDLNQVVVSDDFSPLQQIARMDLKTNPVRSSQEILRRMPGLFIGQHAGGGKAEQIFLRGFDIDHGTDLSIKVDGMPVNMVSHAHGQGYSDLHFLIPETIDQINYGKGPYMVEQGNFATAGYVDFQTKDDLEYSMIGVELGRFNSLRLLGMLDLLTGLENQDAYIAVENIQTDGPFEFPQAFNRLNLMAKYNIQLSGSDQLSFTGSYFNSRWDASGQIPQRAVDQGLITRFGAIDNTEGGSTGRSNFQLDYTRALNSRSFVRSKIYFVNYDFELYSNFTFFLEDPENGDQIKQRESRTMVGFESSFFNESFWGNININSEVGVGIRYDKVLENELSHTLNRRTILENLALGNVRETNSYGYARSRFDLGAVSITPGLRLDYFNFQYIDQLAPTYSSLSEQQAIVSPKLDISYSPDEKWRYYLHMGKGFHSNDSRSINVSAERILPAVYGADLGVTWKPLPRMMINAALWYLYSEQEFVYVGDAGIVEPGGRSRRLGVDAGLRIQLYDWLYLDTDVNYAYARSLDEEPGQDHIPLAPDLTSTGGLSFNHHSGFSGGIHYRFIADRPANEDYSLTAQGYFVTDVNVNYEWKHWTIGISVENLFDTEWEEAQFATKSRLRDEVDPVEEIHFTPGIPFYPEAKLHYRF